MKKGLQLLTISLIMIACSGKEKKDYSVKEESILVDSTSSNDPLTRMMQKGEKVYSEKCAACHQLNGNGLPPAFPPLANSDYLKADKARAITIVLNGLNGEITVNGTNYNGVMPPAGLSKEQAAEVLTYVLNSWGNKEGIVNYEEIP